ncbi:hypothetical protein [Haloquadratum walsbyi]|uniref:Uncharacterized protein n=1 Tax=Haloquadratum walsbyi J07HQW2 TaxID=1238425 RepID=U1N0N8_9EURY|nr:hypothetical protein [Haloquadratum walsbyi]ERG96369.1 MAG: hypothetical protein J07HQW2_02846 [Haloquadratum walsbyi J07HQW2]
MESNQLREAFIRSDASPSGKWWIDIPVGLSVGDDDTYATADAVCLTSRSQELPEVYPDHTGTAYAFNRDDERVGVNKSDMFDALRERDHFAEETVMIVGFESGTSSIGTVGELLAYRELLSADWDWTIDEVLLVSDTDSDHVSYVCGELSIRAMRVTE